MEKSDFSPLPRQALYANKRQWNQFLSIFLLAAGIGFTVTGIIFFFAYNWDELPKFAKLGMVEVLLATSVLLAVFTRWSTLVKRFLPYSGKSIRPEPMHTTYSSGGHFLPFFGQ